MYQNRMVCCILISVYISIANALHYSKQL